MRNTILLRVRSLISRSLEYVLLIAVVVAAGAFVVGRYGEDDGAAVEPAAESLPTCRAAQITPTNTKDGSCRTSSSTLAIADEGDVIRLAGLRVDVRDSRMTEAETREGRSRNRSRVSVRISVRNEGAGAASLSEGGRGVYLSLGGRRIEPDPAARADDQAFRLVPSIPPGDERVGTLRFELSGAATTALVRDRRAQLGVRVRGDRVVVVRLRPDGIEGG